MPTVPTRETVTRNVDTQALFRAQGAWCARVWRHHRGAPRNLAPHRIRAASLLDTIFTSAAEAILRQQSTRSPCRKRN